MSQEKLNQKMTNMTKTEVEYLEENECEKNEHGVYVFISQNGHEHISLDFFLLEYKNWLIEKGIVKMT